MADFTAAQLSAMFEGGAPRTPDEVTITTDGRRLDSKEAVVQFFAELAAERAQAQSPGGGEHA